MMSLDLIGKKALVLASSKGIGFAVANSLSLMGCDLTITSSNKKNLIEAENKLKKNNNKLSIDSVLIDLYNQESVDIAMDQLLQNGYKYDIVILNGPGPKPIKSLEATCEDFKQAFQSTLLSFHQVICKILPSMKLRKFGRIIFICSSTAKEPDEEMILSNTARSSVISYAKTLSREIKVSNITVNSILTASVLTSRTNELLESEARLANLPMDKFLVEASQSIPVGYICEPEEFVNPIAYLCTPSASYVNGISLPIDGGYMRGL